MFNWISSVVIRFINGNSGFASNEAVDCEKILCINSRGIHLLAPAQEGPQIVYLRNKLLGNRKIRYMRRRMFGSERPGIKQILKIMNIDGELFLSTI